MEAGGTTRRVKRYEATKTEKAHNVRKGKAREGTKEPSRPLSNKETPTIGLTGRDGKGRRQALQKESNFQVNPE